MTNYKHALALFGFVGEPYEDAFRSGGALASNTQLSAFGDSSTPTFGAFSTLAFGTHLAVAKKSPMIEGDNVYMTQTENNEANELGNVKKRSRETEDEAVGFQESENEAAALKEIGPFPLRQANSTAAFGASATITVSTIAFGVSPSFRASSSTSSFSFPVVGQSNFGGPLPGQSDGAIFSAWAAALSSLVAHTPASGQSSLLVFLMSFLYAYEWLFDLLQISSSVAALLSDLLDFGQEQPGPPGQPIFAFGQADRELLCYISATNCMLLADGAMHCFMRVDISVIFRSLDELMAHVKSHFSPLFFIEPDSDFNYDSEF
ncbi:hypothetical protein Q3G72_007609 [Acer saccharum]|nr:hypothetical protein Q3G72_007609 [Acer saccharum]